jgi:predicted GNAT family N-acyltransferase
MERAANKKCISIWCNARLSALPFYEKFGMQAEGEPWTKHGIEFIKMNKQLS